MVPHRSRAKPCEEPAPLILGRNKRRTWSARIERRKASRRRDEELNTTVTREGGLTVKDYVKEVSLCRAQSRDSLMIVASGCYSRAVPVPRGVSSFQPPRPRLIAKTSPSSLFRHPPLKSYTERLGSAHRTYT